MTDTHIKIGAVTPRIQYAADGVQTIFSYPFAIFASEDLQVSFNGAPQSTGFTIAGSGQTNGGTVTFATPPAAGTLVSLRRQLPLERITDFQEGGALAALSLNNELDYLTASIQQVASDQTLMLRYPADDAPASAELPGRSQRANQILGFDANGNPVMLPPGSSGGDGGSIGDFTASGTGAVTRTHTAKARDTVSVKDFGAVGDGVTNDTPAFQLALAAHQSVYVPPGTYIIQSGLELGEGTSLFGAGQASIIRASNSSFDLISMVASYGQLHNLRLENGRYGIRLYGKSSPCVQNAVTDVTIWGAQTGIVLDGYQSPDHPCYWNNFARVLVAQPAQHGIWLTRTGSGDTANANRFIQCRVYSLGASTSGIGIWAEKARFNNAFTDCEVNIAATSSACVRVGSGCDKTLFINLYTEALGGQSNIVLDAGSENTSLLNLLSASGGAAIEDHSGGNYTAYEAGYPDKNRMRKSRITDLTVELMRYDTEYVERAGVATVDLALTSSVYLVSSFNGAITARLPRATADGVNGTMMTIKKIDASNNPVLVTEDLGNGPDNRTITLSSRYDFVTIVCNGANWWIVAHNLMPGNALYYDTPGVFTPDLTRSLYLVDAFSGNLEVRLPDPAASHAIGRTVTIKRNDTSSNTLTITKAGGGGPDGVSISLTGKGHALTVMSNGAAWHILSRYQ